jgi:hypothetical protein
MIDETGCEFGVSLEAETRDKAYEELEEMYPESRVDQLEDEEQTRERERLIYERANAEYEGDYNYWGA